MGRIGGNKKKERNVRHLGAALTPLMMKPQRHCSYCRHMAQSLSDLISTVNIHEVDLMTLGKIVSSTAYYPNRWSSPTGRKQLQEISMCHFRMKTHRLLTAVPMIRMVQRSG